MDLTELQKLKQRTLDPELEKRLKRIGIVVAVVLIPFILIDLTMLRGKTIVRQSDRFRESGEVTVKFDVAEAKAKYTVRFDTRKREIALGWTLTDSQGETIDEDTELMRHKGARRFSFYPESTGEHTLVVKRDRGSGGLLSSGSRDSVSVQVLVGDRQILGPLFEW